MHPCLKQGPTTCIFAFITKQFFISISVLFLQLSKPHREQGTTVTTSTFNTNSSPLYRSFLCPILSRLLPYSPPHLLPVTRTNADKTSQLSVNLPADTHTLSQRYRSPPSLFRPITYAGPSRERSSRASENRIDFVCSFRPYATVCVGVWYWWRDG